MTGTSRLSGSSDNKMFFLGMSTTRIEYNVSTSRWTLSDAKYDVTGVSRANELSYVLGKHKWTISNDAFECNEGQTYSTMLKLTGCAEDEFTCDDGQCIKMERRCDQVIYSQYLAPFLMARSRLALLPVRSDRKSCCSEC